MNIQITKKDLKDARLVYWWLLVVPMLAVPCWSFNSHPDSPSFFTVIWAAAFPLIFYAPVFIWAFAPNPYLRAHARQGAVLLALRFLCGVLVGTGAWYMLVGNLILWLVGSLIGLAQAGNGRAWIGNINATVVNYPPVKPQGASRSAPSQESQYYLNVFRTGDIAAREAAARRLEALGQVETF